MPSQSSWSPKENRARRQTALLQGPLSSGTSSGRCPGGREGGELLLVEGAEEVLLWFLIDDNTYKKMLRKVSTEKAFKGLGFKTRTGRERDPGNE